jgi:aconitate hydratase
MVNGLGVLGWGVGGIEAEAAMLGQPISMLIPEVIGFKLTGNAERRHHGDRPRAHRDADAAQEGRRRQIRRVLRAGPRHALTLADRATIGNMAPEYGATCGFFPVDGRPSPISTRPAARADRIALVEAYAKAQGMWREVDAGPGVHRHARARSSATCCRRSPARSGHRTGCCSPNRRQGFLAALEGEFKKPGEAKKRVPVEGPRLRPRPRRRRHRRHHLLHQHLQPVAC